MCVSICSSCEKEKFERYYYRYLKAFKTKNMFFIILIIEIIIR